MFYDQTLSRDLCAMLKSVTQAFIVVDYTKILTDMLMGFQFAQRNTQSKEKHKN